MAVESLAGKISQTNVDEATIRLRELQNSVGIDIPGLDTSSVIGNYVDVEFKDDLDACTTDAERTRKRNLFIQHYATGPGKDFIDSTMSKMKAAYGQVQSTFEALPEAITAISASTLVPAVVTTGSAASVPNPLYSIQDVKTKANTILGVVKAIVNCLMLVFEYAALIHFGLPDSITTLSGQLANIMTLLEAVL